MKKEVPLVPIAKLLVMGYIAKHKDKDGYCHDGSSKIAEKLEFDKTVVQELLTQLIYDNYLMKGPTEELARTIPVKLTEKANVSRVKLFESMFPDIKSVLLSKG